MPVADYDPSLPVVGPGQSGQYGQFAEEDAWFASLPDARPSISATPAVSGKTSWSWAGALEGLTKVTNSVVPLIGALRDKNEIKQTGTLQPGTQRYNGTNVGNIEGKTNWMPIIVGAVIVVGLIVAGMVFKKGR
jgi:hypothetical protein